MSLLRRLALSLSPVSTCVPCPCPLRLFCTSSKRPSSTSSPSSPPDPLLSANDQLHTHVKNRNPMNLERMQIAYQPRGFPLERVSRKYWNKLDLSISNGHTTAVIKHWTGRTVCKASTKEWAIRQERESEKQLIIPAHKVLVRSQEISLQLHRRCRARGRG
jgi:hypothetical protein